LETPSLSAFLATPFNTWIDEYSNRASRTSNSNLVTHVAKLVNWFLSFTGKYVSCFVIIVVYILCEHSM
jgi:hypothetical protein